MSADPIENLLRQQVAMWRQTARRFAVIITIQCITIIALSVWNLMR